MGRKGRHPTESGLQIDPDAVNEIRSTFNDQFGNISYHRCGLVVGQRFKNPFSLQVGQSAGS